MKPMTPLQEAEAELRRLQNIFYTGEVPLFVHQWEIELAQIKVDKLKLGQKDAVT